MFARLREGVSGSDEVRKSITGHMRKTVGAFAVPGNIYFPSALPKTRSGKIMRRILKAVASGEEVGDLSTLEDQSAVEAVIKSYRG